MLDDELPQPPTGGTSPTEDSEANFSGAFDSSLLEGVPGLQEPIPAGLTHFRLDSYKKELDKEGGPRFRIQWKSQQEPSTGRVLFDYVPWVTEDTVKAAARGDSVARDQIKKRMPRMKEIQKAAGFEPKGAYDVELDFLASHPEVKIPVTIQERKLKDERQSVDGVPNPDFGKYTIPTGEMTNGLPSKYISLTRPN